MSFNISADVDISNAERQLKSIEKSVLDNLDEAAVAGAEPMLEGAQQDVHEISGELKLSLKVVKGEKTATTAEALVTSDSEYALAEEFGFTGTDSAGRVIYREPHPYLRPQLDKKRNQATDAAHKSIQSRIK